VGQRGLAVESDHQPGGAAPQHVALLAQPRAQRAQLNVNPGLLNAAADLMGVPFTSRQGSSTALARPLTGRCARRWEPTAP
jgi:hypothetical protein